MPPVTMIATSLQAFMTQLIDYAGLFPPAKLPLDEALQNYAQYLDSAERWMLGRFIIPAVKLPELNALLPALLEPETVFPFSILGRGGDDAASFLDGLKADLQLVAAFKQTYGAQVTAEVLEVRLPSQLRDVSGLNDLLAEAGALLGPLIPYYEPAFAKGWQGSDDWRETLQTVIHALAIYNQTASPRAGIKLRCGGVEATAFPSTEQIAFALAASREAQVPLKATAGLHHPLRHYNVGVQTKMHGFLNVFGAALLSYAHNLHADDLQRILDDETAASFAFSSADFRWQTLAIDAAELARIRSTQIISYGSCSFDEPRDDLRALGIL